MRLLILVLLFGVFLPSCSDRPTEPKPATGQGQLVVYIFWDSEGSPGKRVQVLEAGVEGLTDSVGIVEFALEPGTYTVRAHGLGAPGPSPTTKDESATVRSADTVRVEFFDCRDCSTP